MHEKFTVEDGPDQATRSLVPPGDLDAAAAAEVRRRNEEALNAGKRRVIVDLSAVSYMETAALGVLLDGNARLRRFGASLSVVIPADSRVRIVFGITRLDKVLRVTETRAEALASR